MNEDDFRKAVQEGLKPLGETFDRSLAALQKANELIVEQNKLVDLCADAIIKISQQIENIALESDDPIILTRCKTIGALLLKLAQEIDGENEQS
jgi:hypothetical protein